MCKNINKGKMVFKCELCDYDFTETHRMKQHFSAVHEGKKPFKCASCDYKCYQKANMNRHIAQVHEEKKPFKCEFCHYSCALKNPSLNMFFLFMRVKSHSSVRFVTTSLIQNNS